MREYVDLPTYIKTKNNYISSIKKYFSNNERKVGELILNDPFRFFFFIKKSIIIYVFKNYFIIFQRIFKNNIF